MPTIFSNGLYKLFLILVTAGLVTSCTAKRQPPLEEALAPSPDAPAVLDPFGFFSEQSGDEEHREDYPSESEVLESFKNPKAAGPGHSRFGVVFDGGPRSAAFVPINESEVPTRFHGHGCGDEAGLWINRGMSELFGFATLDSERSFRMAAKINPKCAIAFAGMSLSNLVFKDGPYHRAAAFAYIAFDVAREFGGARVIEFTAALRGRFDASIPTVAGRIEFFLSGLKRVVEKAPNEIDLAALLVLQAWEGRFIAPSVVSAIFPNGNNDLDSILQAVFDLNPRHPAHHMRIHLWNNGSSESERAFDSAKKLPYVFPFLPHNWHMPAHTFRDLGRFIDAAFATEASMRVDRQMLVRRIQGKANQIQVMPYELHNFYHHTDWAISGFESTGRPRKAMQLARELVLLPNPILPKTPTAQDEQANANAVSLGLANPHLKMHADSYRWIGSYLHRSRVADLAAMISTYDLWSEAEFVFDPESIVGLAAQESGVLALRAKWLQARTALELSDLVRFKTYEAEIANGGLDHRQRVLDDLNAWFMFSRAKDSEKKSEALKQIRELGISAKTELVEKFIEFDLTQAKDLALEVISEGKTGDKGKAWLVAVAQMVYISRLLKEDAGQWELLLGAYAGLAERDHSIFSRVSDVITSEPENQEVLKLGGLEWKPLLAPDFARPQDLKKNRAKVMVFSLGEECPMCNLQLGELVRLNDKMRSMGLEVSVFMNQRDEVLELSAAGDVLDLVADPEHLAFQIMGVWDDFEEMPLHGIFLVDAKGQILWQSVSASAQVELEPFLEEADRLLKAHAASQK